MSIKNIIYVIFLIVTVSINILFATKRETNFDKTKLVKPVIGNENISGDRQVSEALKQLSKPLIIQVLNDRGEPIANQSVKFSVIAEPTENYYSLKRAQLSDTIVKTDKSGYAKVYLTLGGSAGEYRVIAKTNGLTEIFYITALSQRWYLSVIFGLLGGLCFFLFGMYYGSKGLRRLAGGGLREIVFNLTKNRILGVFVGMLITIIFQSSTATSVLLISFVNTGLIALMQALAVILGADIGTTFTAQILAFKLYDYALFIIIVGFILMHSYRKIKDVGQAIFGFGLVFFAIKIVFEASLPLKYFPSFTQTIRSFGNYPILGVILSMIFTFLVHSSAATIGIAVGLSFSGLIELRSAIPIILGANLGTSFSPLIASFKTGIEARRVALGHTIFKFITVIVLIPLIDTLSNFISTSSALLPRQIANAHTFINVFATLIFLPFLKIYEKFLKKIIPESKKDKLIIQPLYLDDTILDAPSMALAQAQREVLHMGDIVLDMFVKSISVFVNNDKELRKIVAQEDDQVDKLEKDITAYLTKLSTSELLPELSKRNIALFYIIDDLEHIGDICSKSLMTYAKKKIDYNLMFSEQGLNEIRDFHQEIVNNFKKALAALSTWDKNLAQEVADCREIGNIRLQILHNAHLERLKSGLKESIDTSTIHLDYIADLERINFHCAKIGFAILQSLNDEKIKIKFSNINK